MKVTSHQKHVHDYEHLNCIGVDCRVDKDTLQYKEVMEGNGEKKIKKIKGPERHLTSTREMGTESNYLTHRVIPNIGATGVLLAEDAAAVLEEYNSVNTVKVVLVVKQGLLQLWRKK